MKQATDTIDLDLRRLERDEQVRYDAERRRQSQILAEPERAVPWHPDDMLHVGPYRLVYRVERGRIAAVFLPGHVAANRAGGYELAQVIELARTRNLPLVLPTVRRA